MTRIKLGRHGMQDMLQVSTLLDQWQEELFEVWNSYGLEGAGKLLGQQSGFIKYPCFLCMWDSRDRAQHYTKNWHLLFPLLHIKFGLIKQFTKALDKDSGCFTYLCHAFPGLTIKKLKAGLFDGPPIRELIGDADF